MKISIQAEESELESKSYELIRSLVDRLSSFDSRLESLVLESSSLSKSLDSHADAQALIQEARSVYAQEIAALLSEIEQELRAE